MYKESFLTSTFEPILDKENYNKSNQYQIDIVLKSIWLSKSLREENDYKLLSEKNILDNNFEDFWIWKKDVKDISNSILKNNVNQSEINKTNENELTDKQKIKEYATLSNLWYACFEKIDKNWKTDLWNLKIKEVNLDVASIDFTKFNIDKNWKLSVQDISKLTPEEKFVITYLNQINLNNKDNRILTDKNDKNITDIIDVALLKNKQDIAKNNQINKTKLVLAKNEIDINSLVISDTWNAWWLKDLSNFENKIQISTNFIKQNRDKITEALIKLKEEKISEYYWQFEEFKEKWDFKILSYYPEENSDDTSWFQCVLFEKDWKKILSIAWTKFSDISWDIMADFSIFLWKIPEAQTKSMIDFFKNNLEWQNDITIVWHSLWWVLTQIATAIYWEEWKIKEAYTFNSPWAKDLKVSIKQDNPYKKELENFTKNRKYDNIEEKITNVKWNEWFNFVAGKWVDIWKYRIDVATSSHWINSIISAIDKVDRLIRYSIKEEKEKL